MWILRTKTDAKNRKVILSSSTKDSSSVTSLQARTDSRHSEVLRSTASPCWNQEKQLPFGKACHWATSPAYKHFVCLLYLFVVQNRFSLAGFKLTACHCIPSAEIKGFTTTPGLLYIFKNGVLSYLILCQKRKLLPFFFSHNIKLCSILDLFDYFCFFQYVLMPTNNRAPFICFDFIDKVMFLLSINIIAYEKAIYLSLKNSL